MHTFNCLMSASRRRKFQCSLCFITFLDKASYIRHVKSHESLELRKQLFQPKKPDATVATGSKRVRCTICSTEFSTKSALNRHMRMHMGIKPYGCEFCDRKFSRKDSAMDHQKSHLQKMSRGGETSLFDRISRASRPALGASSFSGIDNMAAQLWQKADRISAHSSPTQVNLYSSSSTTITQPVTSSNCSPPPTIPTAVTVSQPVYPKLESSLMNEAISSGPFLDFTSQIEAPKSNLQFVDLSPDGAA